MPELTRQPEPSSAHPAGSEAAPPVRERTAALWARRVAPWGLILFTVALTLADPRPNSPYAWWLQLPIVVAAVLNPPAHVLAAGIASAVAYLTIVALPLTGAESSAAYDHFDAFLLMATANTLGTWSLSLRHRRSRELAQEARSAQDDAQRALQHLRHRTRTIADELDHALWVVEGGEDEVTFVNRGFEHVWGLRRSVLRQNADAWRSAVHPEDRHILQALGETELAYRITTPAGEPRWVAHVKHGSDTDRDIHIVRDITALRREAAYRSRYAEIVLKLHEDERSQVARTLKERLGQSLAAILVGMRHLEGSVTAVQTAEQVRWMRQSLRDAVSELGRLAGSLHPSFLEELGLQPALQRLADDAKATWNLDVRVRLRGTTDADWPEGLRMTIYRINEEALRNVGVHAHATRVDIDLTQRDHALTLYIEDDGEGFAPEHAVGQGAGLLAMQQRTTLIGGDFRVESAPGHGTTLIVQLPLHLATQPG